MWTFLWKNIIVIRNSALFLSRCRENLSNQNKIFL